MTLHSGPYGFALSFALEPGFALRVVLDADFALDFVLSFALFDLDV
jgi:hypothetical protein